MHHHKRLQRRLMIAVGCVVLLALVVGVPIVVLDDQRLDLAIQLDLVPGKDAEQLTDGNDSALLIIAPLNNGDANGTSPWLYRAQFIAWPNADGNELENLETSERVQIPLASIEYSSANGDGSLMLLRGPRSDTGDDAAITISPATMRWNELASADAVPDAPGEWETSTWEKTRGMCNRPSPNKRFVGCFTRADGASYLAGDWQFDVQIWGDYDTNEPLYRGRGFLPWVGFAQNDTVVYLQNEYGIVRIDLPDSALKSAPAGEPYLSPIATPSAIRTNTSESTWIASSSDIG